MYLLGLSLILLAMKYFEVGPIANWPWWWIAVPFGLTAVWWTWADWSGYTKRKVMEKENAKKNARIQRDRDRLGLNIHRKKNK
ncbi:TIGR04438 family Trp-rich protein [Lampropedia puyangensis]|uniref:TIGR04438 family Trp-rich protein n=1 Tax=Lampropedia puyangensis TaxID=1330072 RepID=A0A4S8FER4_9BURK|nr:TIGR04438 family Trp-rich protein [Lampropedia puyangensis]THU05365.1 TIGR04438 family Trp-rich protein [Lampropedia puyangensis]